MAEPHLWPLPPGDLLGSVELGWPACSQLLFKDSFACLSLFLFLVLAPWSYGCVCVVLGDDCH